MCLLQSLIWFLSYVDGLFIPASKNSWAILFSSLFSTKRGRDQRRSDWKFPPKIKLSDFFNLFVNQNFQENSPKKSHFSLKPNSGITRKNCIYDYMYTEKSDKTVLYSFLVKMIKYNYYWPKLYTILVVNDWSTSYI